MNLIDTLTRLQSDHAEKMINDEIAEKRRERRGHPLPKPFIDYIMKKAQKLESKLDGYQTEFREEGFDKNTGKPKPWNPYVIPFRYRKQFANAQVVAIHENDNNWIVTVKLSNRFSDIRCTKSLRGCIEYYDPNKHGRKITKREPYRG